MTGINSAARAKQQAKHATNDVKPWVKIAARTGYMAKGLVYILIGILALMAAVGVGGKTTNSTGALSSIANEPYGEILLWIIGIGFVGLIMWRIIQVAMDPDHEGIDTKSIFRRVFFAFNGIVYGILAYKAFSLALNAGESSGDSNSKQTLSAKLLSEPFGQWIIGMIGLIMIGYAIYEMYKAYQEKYLKKFKQNEMDEKEYEFSRKSGKIGFFARGIVLLIMGYFIMVTAVTANSENTKGLDGALSKIAQQPYGQWMLGVVALGLTLYGVFQILKGKNRHMRLTSTYWL
ncbi:DUF1206 domain-containing protein [Bacillus sp. 2205SS5-2]|uniref:DUF1206 domain-containing protein n=1 Tax=Bacillus sp. 2205SS5-2 TaxID=3109031 RepID=UPI003007B6A4